MFGRLQTATQNRQYIKQMLQKEKEAKKRHTYQCKQWPFMLTNKQISRRLLKILHSRVTNKKTETGTKENKNLIAIMTHFYKRICIHLKLISTQGMRREQLEAECRYFSYALTANNRVESPRFQYSKLKGKVKDLCQAQRSQTSGNLLRLKRNCPWAP